MELPSRAELLLLIRRIENPRTRCLLSLEYLTGARVSELLSIKRIQIEKKVIVGQDFIQLNQVKVLKRRRPFKRTVIIPIGKEREFLVFVIDYINKLAPDDLLFDFTRQWAWKLIKRHTGHYNHFWRHLRATHLTTDYGLTGQELRHFFGWASSKMADNYSHLNVTDIARKMSLTDTKSVTTQPVTP